MSRSTGGRPDTSADRRMAVGLAVFLSLLFLVLATCRPAQAEAVDPRVDTTRVMAQLEAAGRQINDLASRLEEDRRLLEIRQHAMDRAKLHGTPTWVVERAWDQAHESGLDPAIILQLIEVESDWDESLIHTNADGSRDYGLMQLNERTWPGAARATHGHDPLDPDDNLRAGIYHLAWLVREQGGDMDRALTAYNRGTGGLQTWLASRGTARSPYSDAVLRRGD